VFDSIYLYKILFVSSCLSVWPFVLPSVRMEQLGCHWTDFHEIWYLSIFRKSIQKIQGSLKSDKKNGYFTWTQMYIFISYLAQFFLEWEMFRTKVVEEIKTYVLYLITFFFFRKSWPLWEQNPSNFLLFPALCTQTSAMNPIWVWLQYKP